MDVTVFKKISILLTHQYITSLYLEITYWHMTSTLCIEVKWDEGKGHGLARFIAINQAKVEHIRSYFTVDLHYTVFKGMG